ncbi:hypothetical protein X943_000986 [Babesia divergens]|uniref:Uncharacterized protein n=1 Tax=Babesia divergens TaxID=32595 RepID=A0AAD9LGY4_BABDI|nr:hypothetical protein X943_000986 [Babesia divergens]
MAKSALYRLNLSTDTPSVDKKTVKLIAKDSGKPASKPIAVIPKPGASALDNKDITISVPTLRKAIDALQERAERIRESQTRNLLDDPSRSYVFLQIFLKKIFTETHVRPLKIKLEYPIYEGKDVCLFVKDPQKHWKKLIEDLNIREIKKVIGVDKLRKKYREYKDRKLLASSIDLFLTDRAVAPSLPSLLGKIFIEKKKLPIAINMGREGMRDVLCDAIHSTFYRVSNGNCSSVKVAVTSMKRSEIVSNVVQVSKIASIHLNWEGAESLCLYSDELEGLENLVEMVTSETSSTTA